MYDSMYLAQWFYKRGIGRRLGAWVSLVGGGWHLFFFCHWTGRRDKKPPPSSWTTRAIPHSSSPGSRATPPHQRPPSSEFPAPPCTPFIFQTPTLSGTQRLHLPQAVDNPQGVSQACMWFYLLSFFRYFIIFNDLYSFVWGRQYCKNFYLIKILYD